MTTDARARAAQVAGRARAAAAGSDGMSEIGSRGGAASARSRAGDRDWGRRMAAIRAAKHGRIPPDPMTLIKQLEARIAALEIANAPANRPTREQKGKHSGRCDFDPVYRK